MLPPKFRTLVARFALGEADVADLIDAAHTALDRGIYADGLAVIATTPDESLVFLSSWFTKALHQLGSSLPTHSEAHRRHQLLHLRPILEGVVPPREGVETFYHRCHTPYAYWHDDVIESWRDACSHELADHLRRLRFIDYYGERPDQDDARSEALAKWDGEAIALASKWCAEHGRGIIRPEWCSPTVVALASGIDADKAFDRLPILADALEDAGCDDLDILDHCREGSPHVVDCWMVNLLLGR